MYKLRKTDTWSDYLEAIRRFGADLDDNELDVVLEPVNSAHWTPPPVQVVDLIARYSHTSKTDTVLETHSGPYGYLPALSRLWKPGIAVGICAEKVEYALARIRLDYPPYLWHLIESSSTPNSVTLNVDAAFSVVLASLDWDEALPLLAAKKLAPGGLGFFLSDGPGTGSIKQIVPELNRLGIALEAIISLTDGLFHGRGDWPVATLSIFRSGPPVEVFLGELSSNERASDTLIRNLIERRAGKSPESGILVPASPVRTVHQIIEERQWERRREKFGYPQALLGTLGEIHLPKKHLEARFNEQPNAMYLPSIGNSLAVASLSDLRIKPQNYIQVVLNPQLALADYVAGFLNSDVGRDIRRSCETGPIPRLNKERILQLPVYLPDLTTQSKLVTVQQEIRDTRTHLESLQRELWEQPRRAQDVARVITRMNRPQDFEEWVDTLPFPLASILWEYHHDPTTPSQRVDHLLNFFEACAEFQAALLLSGAYQFNETKPASPLVDADVSVGQLYPRAMFGTWLRVIERLSKRVRSELNEQDRRINCQQGFGMPSYEFLQMVSGTPLLNLMKEMSGYRNDWKGHGGAQSPRETGERLSVLENALSRFRRIVQDRYRETILLLPGSIAFDGAEFQCDVRVIMGTRTPFRRTRIQTSIPLVANRVYMQYNDYPRPVEIPSLFMVRPSPPTEPSAVYFYNRVETGSVRWVSYHYSEDYQSYSPVSEIEPVLELVRTWTAD